MNIKGLVNGQNLYFQFCLDPWEGFCAGSILSHFTWNEVPSVPAPYPPFADLKKFSEHTLEVIADEIFEELQGDGQHLLLAADTLGGLMSQLFDPLPVDRAFQVGEYIFFITAGLPFINANTGNQVLVRNVFITGEGRGGDSESDYFDDEDDDV